MQTPDGTQLHALGATSLIVAAGHSGNFVLTLNSSDSTRKIELSVNGGTEYFTPAYDVISATMLVVIIVAPITGYRLTGLITDTYTVAGV